MRNGQLEWKDWERLMASTYAGFCLAELAIMAMYPISFHPFIMNHWIISGVIILKFLATLVGLLAIRMGATF